MPDQTIYAAADAVQSHQWAARLNMATSSQEVVSVANEYIASLSDPQHSTLPDACLPRPLRTAEDLNDYAYTLTQEQLHFVGSLAVSSLLDRLAVFFSLAATRVAHLSFIDRVRV